VDRVYPISRSTFPPLAVCVVIVREDPECLAMFREAMLGHAGRPTKESGNNVTELDTGITGNSRAYSIDRVRR
jgi:hypothetical protein